MFKDLSASDISYTSFPVYKKWTVTESDISPLFAINAYADYDSVNLFNYNGISKELLYKVLTRSYYFYGVTSSILDEVGYRSSYISDERTLASSGPLMLTDDNGNVLVDDVSALPISVDVPHEMCLLSIPQINIGEGIQRNSVILNADYATLYDDGNSNMILSGSNSSEIWGNVFYDRGLIILTSGIFSGSVMNQYTLQYNSTVTIRQLEVLTSVLPNEFNVSQNPTAVHNGIYINNTNISSSVDPTTSGGFLDYFVSASHDPTGSYLTPYITTIGLYDDEYQLVAIGKLATPIKSLHDYPVNFLIRLDL